MGIFRKKDKKSVLKKMQKSKKNTSGERLDRLDEDGNLPFGWYAYKRHILEPYEQEIVRLAKRVGEHKEQEKIKYLEKLINYYSKFKKFCYTKDVCFKKYFQERWEHCHNSRCKDFEYITPYIEELKILQGNGEVSKNEEHSIAAFIFMSRDGAKIGESKNDYAWDFEYKYKVYDPVKYHKKVIAEGYLVEAEPGIALKRYKVNQLKEILNQNGLSNKGKKEELILRIIENINTETLNLDRYYVPSEKGIEHLKKYEYLFCIGKYNIEADEFEEYKKSYTYNVKTNDIIWRILNDRFNEHNMAKDFGLARNEQFKMAELLESEGKNVDALFHYILVIYYDTSGCGNNAIVNLANITIAPGVIGCIYKLKDFFIPEIFSECDKYTLPHHYLKKKKFEKLVFDIFNDETIDIKKYIK